MPLTQTNPAFEIKISTGNPNGIFTNSQEISLFAKVSNNTETKSRGQITTLKQTQQKKNKRQTTPIRNTPTKPKYAPAIGFNPSKCHANPS